MTNHGCLTTIPRPNGKVRNGTRKVLLVRKKASMSRSKVKKMIIVFFDSRGIMHKELVSPGMTVYQAFYRDLMERFRKRVQRVRPDIADNWVLCHDNVPAHNALSIREFLAKKNIPVLPHPPYSPCDFYLFPKLKLKLKGHHFGTIETIQKNCNRWPKHTYGKWLPVLLWSVEEMLEPLCIFPRVILRRR